MQKPIKLRMLDFVLSLLALTLLLASIAPMLGAGGLLIAAFMRRQHIGKANLALVLELVALACASAMALWVSSLETIGLTRLLAALTLLGAVHVPHYFIRRFIIQTIT